MNLSGAAHDKAARPGYYARMVRESMGKGDTTSEEIERDLHRSLPEHKAFQRPKSSDAFSAQSAAGLETNAIFFCLLLCIEDIVLCHSFLQMNKCYTFKGP